MSGPVSIDQGLCLTFNYSKIQCRRCRDICPAGCISDGLAIDSHNCSECGLCSAVCPAEAVAVEGHSRRALENALADAASPIRLSCRRDEGSAWPCLGFLDTRLLLAMVLSGVSGGRLVTLDNSKCGECRPQVAAYLDQLIQDVNLLLAATSQKLILQGEGAPQSPPREKVVSRRAFFASLLGATVETVREAVVGSGDGECLPRREIFNRYVQSGQFPDIPTGLFFNLTIGETCNACGLCRKVCPNKAIVIEDQGVALDFYHRPVNCTGCGICVAHCPQGAVTLTAASHLSTYRVAGRELPRCPSCHQIYQPVGNQTACLECFFKTQGKLI